jgi:hypothetical protein
LVTLILIVTIHIIILFLIKRLDLAKLILVQKDVCGQQIANFVIEWSQDSVIRCIHFLVFAENHQFFDQLKGLEPLVKCLLSLILHV